MELDLGDLLHVLLHSEASEELLDLRRGLGSVRFGSDESDRDRNGFRSWRRMLLADGVRSGTAAALRARTARGINVI